MSLAPVLTSLSQYLAHCVEEGCEGVEIDPHVLAELRRPARTRAASADAAPAAADAEAVAGGLDAVAREVADCTLCSLHEARTQTVPGQGAAHPDILFVGEAPGHEEDQQGLAFVGQAGQLLTKMIAAMGYSRDEVFIGNVLKCRPPNNRDPLPEEMETCMPYLKRQIALLEPKVIIALGATSAKALLRLDIGITKLRGTWHTFEGIPLMPTYHPAHLLRNPGAKRHVWEDLKAVLTHLDRPVPEAKKKET